MQTARQKIRGLQNNLDDWLKVIDRLKQIKKIRRKTTEEGRLDRVERKLEKMKTTIAGTEPYLELYEDFRTAIDPYLDAERFWNGICLAAVGTVAIIYFSPLAIGLQRITKGVEWTVEKVEKTKQWVDSTIAPDLMGTPYLGERIAGWEVTSEYGPRKTPCSGCSTFHQGVDLADPRGEKHTMGRKLYAVGEPGTKTELTCWQDSKGGGLVATLKPESMPNYQIDLLHLSSCSLKNGETRKVNSGTVVAKVGNSGLSTGAHLDIRVKKNEKRIPPARGLIWWTLDGTKPQPIIAQRRFEP